MTARWEELRTAEEVVEAFDAGQAVESMTAHRGKWKSAKKPSTHAALLIKARIASGLRFRALIEEAKA